MPGSTTQVFTISLGPNRTGLVASPGLVAQLRDQSGSAIGGPVTTGFGELGGGNYRWTATIPEGFRGTVDFKLFGGAAPLVALPINPEELEYIRDIRDSIGAGTGATLVDHDYGTIDALRYVDPSGNGIAFAEVKAIRTSDYQAGRRSNSYVKGRIVTDSDGRWQNPMNLFADTYTMIFYLPGAFGPDTRQVTVT